MRGCPTRAAQSGRDFHPSWVILALAALCAFFPGLSRAGDRVEEQFDLQVRPILEDYCYACHDKGSKKGGVVLDAFAADRNRLHDTDLWWRVLKNVRAGMMPPSGKPGPSEQERRLLENWIKTGAFGVDPKNPDPGRVTVRRLIELSTGTRSAT